MSPSWSVRPISQQIFGKAIGGSFEPVMELKNIELNELNVSLKQQQQKKN